MNLNKAFIIGNLTRDPESRSLPNGTPISSFGVATNRVWKKDGEQQKDTQFHNIVAFGRLAEICNQYLKKGGLVLVEGRIQTKNWEAQDGAKRNKTEIIMESMQMGPRRDSSASFATNSNKTAPSNQKTESLDTIEYPEENNDPTNIPF